MGPGKELGLQPGMEPLGVLGVGHDVFVRNMFLRLKRVLWSLSGQLNSVQS